MGLVLIFIGGFSPWVGVVMLVFDDKHVGDEHEDDDEQEGKEDFGTELSPVNA